MYVKSADTFSFVFDFVPDWYKTPEPCDKKVEFFLPSLKFVPDLFATRKIIKNMMMIYYRWRYNLWLWRFHKYVTFFSNKIDISSVDINNINLVDGNFDNDDPETIIHVRCMDCHNRFKESKHLEKKKYGRN